MKFTYIQNNNYLFSYILSFITMEENFKIRSTSKAWNKILKSEHVCKNFVFTLYNINDINKVYPIPNFIDNTLMLNNSHIKYIKHAKNIDISKNFSITDFSDFKNSINLNISETNIMKLSLIDSIEDLNLKFTNIDSLYNIIHMKKIKKLNLSHTYVNEISYLSELRNLEYLDLSYTYIEDVTSLYTLDKLKYVNLSHTKVKDVFTLSSVYNLNLSNTKVEDISMLNNVYILNITNTNIRDVSMLPNLEYLLLYNKVKVKVHSNCKIIRNMDKKFNL